MGKTARSNSLNPQLPQRLIGCSVIHKTLGTGVIKSIRTFHGEKRELIIRFDDCSSDLKFRFPDSLLANKSFVLTEEIRRLLNESFFECWDGTWEEYSKYQNTTVECAICGKKTFYSKRQQIDDRKLGIPAKPICKECEKREKNKNKLAQLATAQIRQIYYQELHPTTRSSTRKRTIHNTDGMHI